MLRASIRREKRSCLKTTLLFLAITIHNFPEGLAVGVAFELWLVIQVQKPLSGRLAWPLGLACKISQLSIPIPGQMENLVSMPLLGIHVRYRRAHRSPSRSSSGPIYDSHLALRPLAAAGAMIFVVVEELIPDSQTNGNTDVATLGLMVGFVIMMILDVALG